MLEEALQYVTPELFLLDCDMPQRSGFDLVPVIRSYAVHKTTPIIFLTSTGTADNISTAIKLGACDYVVKPFQADMLRQKVATNIVRKNSFEL
jgi:two-component system chemotaxis response regulator CheY